MIIKKVADEYNNPDKEIRDYIRQEAFEDYDKELDELVHDFKYAIKKLNSALVGHKHNEITDRGNAARYSIEDLMYHLDVMEALIEEVRDDEEDTEN